MVLVQVEVDAVNTRSIGGGEPVAHLLFLGKVFVAEVEQVVEKTAGQDVLDLDLPGPQRVEEEEKLPHGCTGVELMEGFFEIVQLWNRREEVCTYKKADGIIDQRNLGDW